VPANVPANIRIVSGGNTRGVAMWQTLEEWDADGGLYASYVYGNYIDEVLSIRKDPDGSGSAGVQDYFFHQDDLFNVVLVTDDAGDAAERYEYGDYGAPFYFTGGGSSTPSSAINNTRLFNGREWDDESRFYYYRTRYLEPTIGRFTTRDTIGVWGDAGNLGNGVAYVGAKPLHQVDPVGLLGLGNNFLFLLYYFSDLGIPISLEALWLDDDYESHPAVIRASDEMSQEIESLAKSHASALAGGLRCSPSNCNGMKHAHFAGRAWKGISRSDFVHFTPANQSFSVSWFWFQDWTFTIGGHILYMDYDCQMAASCTSSSRRRWAYACRTRVWFADLFSDPLDFGEMFGLPIDFRRPYMIFHSFVGPDLSGEGAL
jgi:RHS repeat-associated protein